MPNERIVHPVRQGRASGKLVARRHWSAFLFNGDPKPILLSKAQADQFIYGHQEQEGLKEFRDPGPEDWRSIEANRYSTWFEAFKKGYKTEIERLINGFIPRAVKGKLDKFCAMVTRIRDGIASGSESPEESYGVHLGRMAEEEKPIVVTRAEIPRLARAAATRRAKADWHRAMEENYVHGIKWTEFFQESESRSAAHGFDFMPRYQPLVKRPDGSYYHSPDPAPRTPEQERNEAFWHTEWAKAYKTFLTKKLQAFMPAEARKKAFWLCALHARLEEVKQERYQRRPRRQVPGVPQ